jgi:hypothetical protein
MRPTLHAGLLMVTLLTIAFLLACRLTHSSQTQAGTDDALDLLLGGSRVFLGGLAMERADLYLHRGHAGNETTAFSNRWFQRIGGVLSPTALEHRDGSEGMKEVLPWITLAARVAPTNIDYVLTQSFLLRTTGNHRHALAELRRLRTRHPDIPDLRLEEARILLAMNQWSRAGDALDTCTRLLGPHPSESQRPLLAEACMWRGLLHEFGSNTQAAASLLDQAAHLEPAMYGDLSSRAQALQAGTPPAIPIGTVFARYQRQSSNPLCTHHGDDEQECGAHEHGAHEHDDSPH